MARVNLPVLAALALASPGAAQDTPDQGSARAAITDYARLLVTEHRPAEAFARYYAADLIQHDPWIGDGANGDDDFLARRQEEQPDKYDPVENYATVVHAILTDGELVAIKSHVFTSAQDSGRLFVDIWRLENGRFAEHWDVIQPVEGGSGALALAACGAGTTYAAAKGAGNTVIRPACGQPDLTADSATSRQIVLNYLALGQEPGRMADAVNRYLAPDFVQHSPNIAPGRHGLIAYMAARAAARTADNRRSSIARLLADHDMVLVHRRVTSDSNPRGVAYIDLFRVTGGHIVEHWDVIQPIPAFSVSGRAMVEGPLEPGRNHGPPPPEHPTGASE